jgi:hypothetical protein
MDEDLTLDDIYTEEELEEVIASYRDLYENSSITSNNLGLYDSDFF